MTRGLYVPEGWGSFWYRDRDAAESKAASVRWYGDSVDFGYTTSDLYEKGYAHLAAHALRSGFGNGGAGFLSVGASNPFTYPGTGVPIHFPITGKSTGYNQGYAGHLVSIDPGGSITFPNRYAHGRYLSVSYEQWTGGGTMTVNVDGNVVQTINTRGLPAQQLSPRVDLSTEGPHAVVITVSGSISFLSGITLRNDHGVIVENLSKSGATSAAFAIKRYAGDPAPDPFAWGTVCNFAPTTTPTRPQGVAPSLVVIPYGVNDYNVGLDVDSYIANMEKWALYSSTFHPNSEFDVLLIAKFPGRKAQSGTYWKYCQGLQALALKNGWACYQVSARPPSSNWQWWEAKGYLRPADVHPTDLGMTVYAEPVTELLTASRT